MVILPTAFGVLSSITGDIRLMSVIFVMVLLGIVLRFYQEMPTVEVRAQGIMVSRDCVHIFGPPLVHAIRRRRETCSFHSVPRGTQ